MKYRIEKYRSRAEWLKARGIGGSDLCSIVNKVGRWGNFIEVYDRCMGQTQEQADTESMSRGRKAEEPIKSLFLMLNPKLKRQSPANSIWLVRRTDYPEMTLSPDTLVTEGREKGFVEIKLKQVFSESKIPEYLMNLKEEEPQYWWQLIDYFIVKPDTTFGYLAVGFDVMTMQDGKWVRDKFVLNWLRITREAVSEDIKAGEESLIRFITENIRPKKRPQVILEGQEKGTIQWIKSSVIQTLKP